MEWSEKKCRKISSVSFFLGVCRRLQKKKPKKTILWRGGLNELISRSSRPEEFSKNVLLKIFPLFTEKHFCRSAFLLKSKTEALKLYLKRLSMGHGDGGPGGPWPPHFFAK